MLLRQICKGIRNFRQKFDRVVFNLLRKACHLLVELGCDRERAEPFESVDERVREAVEAVSVLDDALAFDVVEDFADLVGLELVMVQEFDKARDRTLKVDVVFPERVVGIDEKSL